MDFFRNSVFYVAHRLYQLYESHYSKVGKKGERNWDQKSYRFNKGTIDSSVFRRIRHDCDGRCGTQFHTNRTVISRLQFALRKIVFDYEPATAVQYTPDARHWITYRPHRWKLSCFLFVGISAGKHIKRCAF